ESSPPPSLPSKDPEEVLPDNLHSSLQQGVLDAEVMIYLVRGGGHSGGRGGGHGHWEVDQGILDLGTGGIPTALDTGVVFMDPDGGGMDLIGDRIGEAIIHTPFMEATLIQATDT